MENVPTSLPLHQLLDNSVAQSSYRDSSLLGGFPPEFATCVEDILAKPYGVRDKCHNHDENSTSASCDHFFDQPSDYDSRRYYETIDSTGWWSKRSPKLVKTTIEASLWSRHGHGIATHVMLPLVTLLQEGLPRRFLEDCYRNNAHQRRLRRAFRHVRGLGRYRPTGIIPPGGPGIPVYLCRHARCLLTMATSYQGFC